MNTPARGAHRKGTLRVITWLEDSFLLKKTHFRLSITNCLSELMIKSAKLFPSPYSNAHMHTSCWARDLWHKQRPVNIRCHGCVECGNNCPESVPRHLTWQQCIRDTPKSRSPRDAPVCFLLLALTGHLAGCAIYSLSNCRPAITSWTIYWTSLQPSPSFTFLSLDCQTTNV